MIFADDCLRGTRILVTGASSGIGRETAMLLSRCGAQLALAGRDEGRLGETLASLQGDGHSTHSADLTDADTAADAVQEIARQCGTLDGIFHSAGTTLVLPIKLIKSRHLDEVFGANVRGAFGVARAAARKNVLVDGGSLVFMSSVASVCGRPALSAYCAAKAAVDGLVRSLAVEFAPRRIRVNSITAGAVETAMHYDFIKSISESALRDYEEFHLLGFGQPDDVANAALFLLSDASKWITGTAMAVDGGAAAK
ncbi:MAG TPA: SDR family oxidoreductase [Allosphingosinicella sp.]|nr:SDR family oxidoreductase [Allosphingosinicella sp.]